MFWNVLAANCYEIKEIISAAKGKNRDESWEFYKFFTKLFWFLIFIFKQVHRSWSKFQIKTLDTTIVILKFWYSLFLAGILIDSRVPYYHRKINPSSLKKWKRNYPSEILAKNLEFARVFLHLKFGTGKAKNPFIDSNFIQTLTLHFARSAPPPALSKFLIHSFFHSRLLQSRFSENSSKNHKNFTIPWRDFF